MDCDFIFIINKWNSLTKHMFICTALFPVRILKPKIYLRTLISLWNLDFGSEEAGVTLAMSGTC